MRVETGNSIVQGVATASGAPSGSSGIDRVTFFLGSREEGGLSIGSAVPGMTAGPFGPGSFQATLSFPTDLNGGHDLVAYAHSTVTGQESVIVVPISLGEDPSKAFVIAPTSEVAMCLGQAISAAGASTTPVSPTTPSTTSTMPSTTTTTSTTSTMPSGSSVVLEVSNPSPNDTILSGAFNLSGRAFDKSATSGSGIDRVDIFLDNRDEGGLFLGTATPTNNDMWTATVTLPNNNLGLHNLTVYAHSSVSGTQQTETVPITVTQ
jgi:hypothetical protein